MSDVKKCPHCGKQLHIQAQYCMFCMTSLQPKQDITPSVHKRKKWITTAILLLTVVIVLILILLSNCTVQPPKQKVPAVETTEDIQLPSESSEPDELISAEEISAEEEPAQTQTQEHPETETNAKIETEPETESSTEPNNLTLQTCDHYYIAANCVKPMTCTHCGDTVGTVDTSAHTWKPITSVIHHEEVGHYENVEVNYKKTVYLCFFCGYNQDGYDSLDALREHISVHSNASNYDAIASRPDMLADTREVWATKYEEQWIVDQKAYDETVTVGYVCTLCNAQKD